MRGRFAPSPTGALHLGHAQTMLLCWLQVRAAGGALVMRIEDVDRARSRAGATEQILRDLDWLGFDWDEGPDVGGPFGPYVQSERADRYDAALARLADRTFPCTCSRKEVRAAARVSPEHRGEVAYPGTCRAAPSHDDGRASSLRARVDPGEVGWRDGVLGERSERPSEVCGDFIVRAKNGDHVYQVACVVDDVEMDITHVLRGADLVDSTGRQLLLYRWLGADAPEFTHVPLRLDGAGERLAKSRGSPPLAELREAGEAPDSVIGRLANDVGLTPAAVPCRPRDLVDAFAAWWPEGVAG